MTLAEDRLAPVWAELARRFGDGPPPVRVTLRGLSLDQRQALADLLAMDRLPAPTVQLAVSRLATALRADDADGLRAMVEHRLGPITDRRQARLAARQDREALWGWLGDHAGALPVAQRDPEQLRSWIDTVRAGGVPRGDVERHRRRLAGVLAVLAALPADGIGLAGLADDVLGDPHALERGRSSAGLVLEAVAIALGRERPTDAESARALWEEMGVVPDPLSSTALALGLHPAADHALAAWLRAMSAAGEPAVLTLAQLRRWPLDPLPADRAAFVVENPSLLVEAAAGRWSGPPLVCSSGRPTIAVVTLLRQLGAAGATLFQHADLDAAGLGITAWLAQRAGTTPWRMDNSDYLAAVAVCRDRVSLAGRIPPAEWDPPLVEAMTAHGVAVHEEEIRADLLAAMAR